MRVHFESLTKEPLHLYVVYDPSLSGNGDDDSGSTVGQLAGRVRRQIGQRPRVLAGVHRDLERLPRHERRLDRSEQPRRDGLELHLGARRQRRADRCLALTGKPGSQNATLALGFGTTSSAALASAHASLGRGFDAVEHAYQSGWHHYLAGHPRPWSVAGHEELYDVSLMVLGASEDKTYRGAFIASPTMAWVWGQIPGYNGPYHLVWSRDLYEMATAEIAAGYRAAAGRALAYLWNRQQEPNGCFPQNSNVDGTPLVDRPPARRGRRPDPARVAARADGRGDLEPRASARLGASWPTARSRRSAGRTRSATRRQASPLRSPALSARRRSRRTTATRAAAAQYRAVADDWRSQLDHWTVTTNGPLSSSPYFLRLTVDGNADAGTTYTLSDGGPTVDQRTVVDPSFLELVRLGVLRADNPASLSTLPVVDRELGVDTPNGEFWHRYNHDGYGESLDRRAVRDQRRRRTPVADLRGRARRVRTRRG